LQELHDPELHDPQPEEEGFSTPDMPKREGFFLTSSEPQAGQFTVLVPKTSLSKSSPHRLHRYSKMGMFSSSGDRDSLLYYNICT
jgi:hypothetical protein